MTQKLLLVDDSGLARRSMRAILEPAGFSIVEAADGMAAIERYYLEKPDLVILDLVMKGMYGLDVLTKLREMDPVTVDARSFRRFLASDIPQNAVAVIDLPPAPARGALDPRFMVALTLLIGGAMIAVLARAIWRR